MIEQKVTFVRFAIDLQHMLVIDEEEVTTAYLQHKLLHVLNDAFSQFRLFVFLGQAQEVNVCGILEQHSGFGICGLQCIRLQVSGTKK